MSDACLLCSTPPLPSSCDGIHEERAVWLAIGLAMGTGAVQTKTGGIFLCSKHVRTVASTLKALLFSPEQIEKMCARARAMAS